jgi:general secretion pathway protein F
VTTYRYRAATPTGEMKAGTLEAGSHSDVLERLRRLGLMPIEAVETAARTERQKQVGTATRRAIANAFGELAVLLSAGLTLERALAVSIENITDQPLKAQFTILREKLKEGVPLARAMAEADGFFPPMACAMAEAGEASGKLDASLSRLAETLDNAETLRQTIVSSLIYPIILLCVATSVILLMLLFVVPQFEDLFSDAGNKLPFATQVVMGASHALRSYGLFGLLALIVAGVMFWRWLSQAAMRRAIDRRVLNLPQIGPLIRNIETARFARTLGSLVDSGVALPTALGIAQRSLINTHMAAAVGKVASGLKEGGGLSGPLAATQLFPPMALSFLRTGEETAQLGLMLNRLADVLDRDVRTTIQRMIAILTPAITVVMGVLVAGTIASIMSAILGFNDLALGP